MLRTLSRSFAAVAFITSIVAAASADESRGNRSFQRHQLSDQFFAEGAHHGDFNRDGAQDIVYGPYWYAGPEFKQRLEYYEAKPFDIAAYSDNFFAFTHDFNEDGWDDILIIGFPGMEAFWYENPQGGLGHWSRHLVFPVVDNESPTFTDITGDGRPEMVFCTGGQLGYAEIPADGPRRPWKFRAVTPDQGYQRYTHGLGVGDVNNDGRTDLLEKNGWWEHPAAGPDAGLWKFHEVQFSEPGGAQMLVYDVDADGDNDVITAKAAHAYGLAWFESEPAGDSVKFREHKIMGENPEENAYGVAFSQLHALALADMNSDGIEDVVTGKRFWAHGEHDPGSLDPAVLYWFQIVRDGGKIDFIPHQIDDNSGVGTQVVVGDLNDDDRADVIVGNKKGAFAFVQHATFDPASGLQPAGEPARSSNQPEASAREVSVNEFPATTADGRVLNLDFETGDLTDWTAEGNAFQGQPIEGDTVHLRRSDMVSGHKGRYWIGTYERAGDGPQGLLTSVRFPVTHPYASFFIGGGAGRALGAEIVRSDTGDVIFRASGHSQEEMQPVVVDLRELGGKEIFIRIVDRASTGWAHTNFDHFRFHDEKPHFDHNLQSHISEADHYPYAGLPADEAARVMRLPEGFKAIAAAAEPDVKQPIAMAIDDRGRVWIAEAYEYPVRAPEGQGRDRILIFEDTDGDGTLDKRKIFAEGLNLVSGVEVGFGGVWVGAAPYLMFIPDRDGDDVPDGEPEILLDGWAWQDTHETLNTFIWGPDGWLYGCHGVFTHSRVGKPGTPDAKRIPLNAAIWRYHPTRHKFEIFAEGTSNPWGVDFDDHGQAFATACVIPHLYHIIQGARYQRQAGSHFNVHTYDDIKTIADHLHYLGESSHARNDSSGAAGGGHAHAGAMIYLGDKWPDEYRGRIFMNNIHGQRLNTDNLKPKGSGFVGSHGPDFLLTGDLASQILNIRYGPDGNAWVIDWYDTNACHHNNPEGHDRSNGRIYKVVYQSAPGRPRPRSRHPVDLKQLSDLELAERVLHKNDWYVRHARRILQERAGEPASAGGTTGKNLNPAARKRLIELATTHPDARRRLRSLWALHVTGGVPPNVQGKALRDQNEYVRGWAIQLALDSDEPQSVKLHAQFVAMARQDSSPVVRLYLASALQRLPLNTRWPILQALASHAEDADDHNLPLMYWYAAEPLAEADPKQALQFALECGKTIPQIRDFMLRRIGSIRSESALAALVGALGKSQDEEEQLVILRSIRRALRGQRRVVAPPNWHEVYARLLKSVSQPVRTQATALGVTLGDESALAAFREVVIAANQDRTVRREALEALLAAKDPQLVPVLQNLLADAALRDLALRGLALYQDDESATKILAVYAQLPPAEKSLALAALTSRPAYAIELLKAVEQNRIPPTDLTADLIRQLHNMKNDDVNELVAKVWGAVRSTPEDKAKLIAQYRELIQSSAAGIVADPELGRAVFAKTCQQCHTLYGVGDTIGPDLTGSNRSDIDYLLSNIVDPSAVIAKEYLSTVIITTDGRVITGLVSAEDDQSVTIRTATETIVIPQDEIDDRQLSEVSMMPDDQLKQFSDLEIQSLFAYLRGKTQSPMLATKENAGLLFNGRNLTGWQGESHLWSVENGEVVGRSTGLDHNSFLISDLAAKDFRLTLDVKLVNDEGNSGIQFRSQPHLAEPHVDESHVAEPHVAEPHVDESLRDSDSHLVFHEVRGYQADIGPGWWGKLYEENGRALLWDKSGEQHVKRGDWNRYKIEAVGSRIRTWINDNACVDLDDPEGRRRGIVALQLHSGPPTEVRFRNLKLEVFDAAKSAEPTGQAAAK